MAENIGKLYMVFEANASKLINEVGGVRKQLSQLEVAAKNLKNTMLGMFGAYQIINGIQYTIKTLADFDKTMTQVGVITGATGSNFDKLEKNALSLGRSTQYTAKQVAELQLEFGRLGFSTKEILQSTSAVVDLATATGEGLARSAEIAGSTLRAFNLDASEMGRVTDVMAASLNESALTLDSFADGIKYVAPVAAATNVTLEETAAMMSVLADAGIKGSQAGTSLRRIFTMLTDTGKPLQERLDDLAKSGITLAQANDEVGLYAQTALLVLTKYKTRIDELTVGYNNATGATKDMARAMEDNLGTSITKVSTALDALILSLSSSKGALKGIADAIAETLRGAAEAGPLNSFALLASGPSNAMAIIKRFREIGKAAEQASEDSKKLDDTINELARGYVDEFGEDVLAIQKNIDSSIETSIYKNEILASVYDILIVKKKNEASAIVKNLELTLEQINADKERIKLAEDLSELQRGARIATLERKLAPIALSPMEALSEKTKLSPESLALNTAPVNAMADAYANLSKTVESYGFNLDYVGVEQAKQIATIELWGNAIADVIDNVIAKDQDFAKSAAETTARIIDSTRKEIAIYIAKAAAKALALNPTPGGIATASAIIGVGLSLVSGVLKKFAKTSDTNVRVSGSSSRVSSYGASGSQNSVSFVLKGQDIYGSISNYQRNNGFTTIGG